MSALKTFRLVAAVAAGHQFVGFEFAVSPPNADSHLRVRELNLKMGPEAKSWRIAKVDETGTATAILQSAGFGGQADDTTTDVVLIGSDIDVLLFPGDRIGIFTLGATAAMRASLYFDAESNEA